jgi:hypothetical protein
MVINSIVHELPVMAVSAKPFVYAFTYKLLPGYDYRQQIGGFLVTALVLQTSILGKINFVRKKFRPEKPTVTRDVYL